MKKTRTVSETPSLSADLAARELKRIAAATDEHTMPPPAARQPGG